MFKLKLLCFLTIIILACGVASGIAFAANEQELDPDFLYLVNGSQNYGGSQTWWQAGSTKYNTGCGPVAAANMTAYMAKYDNRCSNLYTQNSWNRTPFIAHQDVMWNYITTTSWGTTAEHLIYGVLSFAQDRNVPIVASHLITNSGQSSFSSFCNTIRLGLQYNVPVGMRIDIINLFEPDPFERHWVTITEYWESGNIAYAKISSWGNAYTIPLNYYFYSTNLDIVFFTYSSSGGQCPSEPPVGPIITSEPITQ